MCIFRGSRDGPLKNPIPSPTLEVNAFEVCSSIETFGVPMAIRLDLPYQCRWEHSIVEL